MNMTNIVSSMMTNNDEFGVKYDYEYDEYGAKYDY